MGMQDDVLEPFVQCKVQGCERSADTKLGGCRGWCSLHYQRWRRHGDPKKVLLVRPESGVGYDQIHKSLRAHRGSASRYRCAAPQCEEQATQWAWQHTGPHRIGQRGGKTVTWGTNRDDYAPMCRRHNSMLDGGGTLLHCPKGHERAVVGVTAEGKCAQCDRDAQKRRYKRKKDEQ